MTGNSKKRRTKSAKQIETTETNTKKVKKVSKKKSKTKVNKPFKAPDVVQRQTRSRTKETANANKETSLKDFEGLADKSTVTDVDAIKTKDTAPTKIIDSATTPKEQVTTQQDDKTTPT